MWQCCSSAILPTIARSNVWSSGHDAYVIHIIYRLHFSTNCVYSLFHVGVLAPIERGYSFALLKQLLIVSCTGAHSISLSGYKSICDFLCALRYASA